MYLYIEIRNEYTYTEGLYNRLMEIDRTRIPLIYRDECIDFPEGFALN